jgi:hypothetical protein
MELLSKFFLAILLLAVTSASWLAADYYRLWIGMEILQRSPGGGPTSP